MKKSTKKSLGEAPETPYASVRPDRKVYDLPNLGLDDAYKVFILIRSLLAAGSKIKCAAGTLRAYLRRRTDDVYIVRIQPQLSGKGALGHSPKRVLPTFARTKVGPRRVGVLALHPTKSPRRRRRLPTCPPRQRCSPRLVKGLAPPSGDHYLGLNRSFTCFSS